MERRPSTWSVLAMRKVLTVADSDCSGRQESQADLKTFSAHRVFGMSVVVSVVAENTSRVIAIQDVTDMIEADGRGLRGYRGQMP